MKISDLVALAKMGYSPAEVKDLLSMEPTTQDTPEEKTEEQKTEPKASPEDEPAPEIVETINYKELYTDAEKEIESLRDQLKTAQAQNTALNVAPLETDSDSDILNDLARAFM